MEKINNSSSATSMPAAIIGIIGTVLTLLHFILSSGSNTLSTTQMIEVVLLLLCNIGIVLVGFISRNSKDTMLIPYAFGIIAYLMFVYEYLNNIVVNEVTMATVPAISQALFYFMGCVAFVIAYMTITGKIKNDRISFIVLSLMLGGFLYSMISATSKAAYRYLKAESLGSYALSGKMALMMVTMYFPYVCLYLGMMALQFSINRKEKE